MWKPCIVTSWTPPPVQVIGVRREEDHAFVTVRLRNELFPPLAPSSLLFDDGLTSELDTLVSLEGLTAVFRTGGTIPDQMIGATAGFQQWWTPDGMLQSPTPSESGRANPHRPITSIVSSIGPRSVLRRDRNLVGGAATIGSATTVMTATSSVISSGSAADQSGNLADCCTGESECRSTTPPRISSNSWSTPLGIGPSAVLDNHDAATAEHPSGTRRSGRIR